MEATSSYRSISKGMHAFVVPRALYMESRLKDRIERGYTWPLDTSTDPTATEFYAEDTAQADISEAVTSVTAGKLTGYRTYWLLQYLRQNASGAYVLEAVDVTAYVPLLNLPTDAVNIVPWAGVTNGPTGEAPSDFWGWLGGLFVGVVNGLLRAGQLLYGGLIAIGTFFVALGEAIGAWGMQLVGTYQQAFTQIQGTVQRVGEVLTSFVDWIVAKINSVMDIAITSFISPIVQIVQDWVFRFIILVGAMFGWSPSGDDIRPYRSSSEASPQYVSHVASGALILGAIVGVLRAVEIAVGVLTGAILATLLIKNIAKGLIEKLVQTLVFTAFVFGATALAFDIAADVFVIQAISDALGDVAAAVGAALGAFALLVGSYALYDKVFGRDPVTQRLLAFGVAVLGLTITVLSSIFVQGPLLAIIDFMGIALTVYGAYRYYKKSQDLTNRGLDIVSGITAKLEKFGTYGSVPLAIGQAVEHWHDGKYDQPP